MAVSAERKWNELLLICFLLHRQEGVAKRYVVQAMNREERKQWMDAMEGKEPVSVRCEWGCMGKC